MKRRILTVVMMAVLIISLLSGSIPAAFAAENAENAKFLVGYSKQDVNPWVKSPYTGDLGIEDKDYTDNRIIEVALTDGVQKMVSVPLAGYSTAMSRFSTEMADDNGDGVVGLGDGLFTSATAVTDQYGSTMIFVTLDAIGAFDKLLASIRASIPAAIAAEGGTVTANQIMFSTSHSHEGTDFDSMKNNAASGSAWEAYYNYAVDKITKAAVEAYKTRAEADMTKGEVDAKEATAALGKNGGKGYEMNTVRHYYMINGYGSSRTFVGAGEFNNFSDLIYSAGQKKDVTYKTGTNYQSPVAEANDTMYLLKFTPEGQDPIVLVNWRAHPSALGGETATVLSSDYINALRYQLEQSKDHYRVGFFQGASGNINPRNASVGSNSWHNFEAGYSSNVAGTAEAAPKNTNIYGRLLAEVALYGLEHCMTEVLDASIISAKHLNFDATREDGTTFKQPVDAIALGKEVMIVVAAGEYFDRYDSNYKEHYQATYEKYSKNWLGIENWTKTALNTYNLPQLLLNKDKNITVSGYTYNEWNSLNSDIYGTPFFFGYSTTRNGYVPNTMAYEYNTGLTGEYASTPTLTDGTTKAFQTVSYEVTASSNLAKGEGEKIIAAMAQLVQEVSVEVNAGYEITDANGNVTGYDTFDEVIAAYNAGATPAETTSYIKLYKNISEDITISKDVYLDLNGKKITGNVTVAEGSTLYCMDSYTDDYNVKDGKGYAVITGTVTGDVQGLPEGSPISGNERGEGYTAYYPGYLKIVENGETSFHRVDLGLKEINFNPADLGMSYTCDFSGDQVVARNVKQYGVAISITEAPNANNISTECGFSIFTNYVAGKAVNAGRSTRLVNIMRESYKDALNEQLAESRIFGSAYLLTENDEYVFGSTAEKTLKETVVAADASFADAAEALQKSAVAMYRDFKAVMSGWNIPNIQTAAGTDDVVEDDGVLKILMIGNSHGVDATKMLGEVFKTAAPDQKFVIGALYHSGCRIDQHLSYIKNNEGNYIYYEIDETKSNWSRIPEHKVENGVIVSGEQSNGDIANGVTLDYGLLAQDWDIITLQQMSTYAAYDKGTYNFDQLDELVDYVLENATGAPKLYWHTSWTHPNDDVRVATYAGTGYGSNWYKNHVTYFRMRQNIMYRMMVANVEEHILSNDKFDGVLDTLTAVQYMQDVLGYTEEKVYRDGTHVSNFGRMLTAYLWYCTLTGDTPDVADIPSNVPFTLIGNTSGNSKIFQYPAYRTDIPMYTDAMKQDIVTAVSHTLQNPLTLPEGAQEPERIIYADQMNGVWVCGDVVADLKNAKTVAGVAVSEVATDVQNNVTITLADGDVVLARVNGTTMKVTSVTSAMAATAIAVDSVFTFQAN